MAKYSTNSNNDKTKDLEDASCELCGNSNNLRIEKVSGAETIICKKCSKESHIDNKKIDNQQKKSSNTRESTPTGRLNSNPDNSWVEKERADYGKMEKPYMKPNYSNILKDSIDESQIDKICDEIDMQKKVFESILNGKVIKNNITKNEINKIEDYLDIELQDYN